MGQGAIAIDSTTDLLAMYSSPLDYYFLYMKQGPISTTGISILASIIKTPI